MIVANLVVRFVVELAGLAGLAVWGAGATSNSVGQVALAIAAPLVAAGIWGVWSAPKATRRLPGTGLLGLELALLAAAVAALAAAGHPLAAGILGVVAVVNGAILRRAYAAGEAGPESLRTAGREGRLSTDNRSGDEGEGT
jgi:hypothetical protein